MNRRAMKRLSAITAALAVCATASLGSMASAAVAPADSGGSATAQITRQGDISAKPWVPTTLTSTTVNGIRVGPPAMTGMAFSRSSSSAAKNSIYVCQQGIPLHGGGFIPAPNKMTLAKTPWVSKGNLITISKIATVPGAVQLPHNFKVTVTKNTRHFKGNGIPNHPIGIFPIPRNSAAYSYYSPMPAQGYPNAAEIPVLPYDLDVTVPRNPKPNATPTCFAHLTEAIATQTGSAWHVEVAPNAQLQIFDPNAALPTDRCFGHPYAGMYHYHGYSWKCFPNQGAAGKPSPLYGYAIDGFGIYGPFGENGKLVHNTDLDVCHGHYGRIKWDGVWKHMYHYHLNTEFPYSMGCFRGTPVKLPDSMTMNS